MELRLNLVFLGVVTAATAALTASEPYAAIDPAAGVARRLGVLEDDCARHPEDESALVALTDAYLDHGRPSLVVAAVGRARLEPHETPEVAHRLARAYESLGRFSDARAAATRALERCRALPDSGCAASRLVLFDIHKSALDRIVAMGIGDPRDARIRTAYDRAMRRIDVPVTGG